MEGWKKMLTGAICVLLLAATAQPVKAELSSKADIVPKGERTVVRADESVKNWRVGGNDMKKISNSKICLLLESKKGAFRPVFVYAEYEDGHVERLTIYTAPRAEKLYKKSKKTIK